MSWRERWEEWDAYQRDRFLAASLGLGSPHMNIWGAGNVTERGITATAFSHRDRAEVERWLYWMEQLHSESPCNRLGLKLTTFPPRLQTHNGEARQILLPLLSRGTGVVDMQYQESAPHPYYVQTHQEGVTAETLEEALSLLVLTLLERGQLRIPEAPEIRIREEAA